MYLENVLIKLRRQYKKDEVIMFALNSINNFKEQLQKQTDELNKYKEYFKTEKLGNEILKKKNVLLCEEIDKLKKRQKEML